MNVALTPCRRPARPDCCQVMAILHIALAQATDCLDIAAQLAPASRKTYDEIRERCPKTVDDTPFYREIDSIEQYLKSHDPIKDN